MIRRIDSCLRWCVIAGAMTTLGATPALPPTRTKVAVLALKAGPAIDPKTAELVTETFVAALQQRRPFEVVSSKDVEMALGLERQRQLLGCESSGCAVELGGALGADYLVSGSLGRLGESRLFNLEALNMHSGLVEQRFSQRLKGSTDEAFLDLLGPAIDALFPSGFAVGSPRVDGGVAIERGDVKPLPPATLRPALAGKHPRLSFTAEDLPTIRTRVAAAEFKAEWAALLAGVDEWEKAAEQAKDTKELLRHHVGLSSPGHKTGSTWLAREWRPWQATSLPMGPIMRGLCMQSTRSAGWCTSQMRWSEMRERTKASKCPGCDSTCATARTA